MPETDCWYFRSYFSTTASVIERVTAMVYQQSMLKAAPVSVMNDIKKAIARPTASSTSATMTILFLNLRRFTICSLCKLKARGKSSDTLKYCPMKSACCTMKHY